MSGRLYGLLLLSILTAGGYLRFADLGGPALWHDEIIHRDTTELLARRPWYSLLTGFEEVDGRTENGPVYYWTQALGLAATGGSDLGVRLLPAIFGLLALPVMAAASTLVGGRVIGLVAALLLALSPLHVYFSREGRPYSLLMLLALVLTWVLLDAGSRGRVALAVAACLVAALTAVHSVPILGAFAALAGLMLLNELWQSRGRWAALAATLRRSFFARYVLVATVALMVAGLLYLTRSDANQIDFEGGQAPVFIAPLSRRAFERFAVSMATSGHQSGPLVMRTWAFLGLALVGLFTGLRRDLVKGIAAAGMFLLPAALSVAALVAVGRWYGLRYTTSALPAFVLLVAVGIGAIARWVARPLGSKPATVGMTAAALALLLTVPNVEAARSDPYEKLDWRALADFVEGIALDNEPIVVANAWPQICLGHYLRQSGSRLRVINLMESVERGERAIARYETGWLLTAGYRETGDVRAWMHGFPPVRKDRREEMALFFFPDLETLLESRFAAGKGALFARQFDQLGGRFDFGGAEMMLQGRGWSYHEENREGISYQWALGEEAVLGLPVTGVEARSIRFRALPFTFAEAPPQVVGLWLNDVEVASVPLTRGWSEHEVKVPAAAWREGANILDLRFAESTIPATVIQGSHDRRNLSAAFDYLEVVPVP